MAVRPEGDNGLRVITNVSASAMVDVIPEGAGLFQYVSKPVFVDGFAAVPPGFGFAHGPER